MKTIQLHGGSVTTADFAIQGNAMLGIKESGKTYAATFMAERLFEAGVPFIAFDPIGVWRFLKVAAPGTIGKGFPIVVAGGEEPDLPLNPASAPEIVRAAMRERVSLVLDLYDMKLSKADWRRIVAECIRVLLYENKGKGIRHVFIEEAAEFAPQQVQPEYGVVYAEVEKLVRMGGNSSLGVTLINQRSQTLNKNVLELCEGLFLFRQKGSHSIGALEKWLEQTASGMDGEVVRTIPTLATGECWYWPPQSQTPARVRFPVKSSLHPDRRHPVNFSAQAVADAGQFIAKLRDSVATIAAEQAANDPTTLRKELADVKRQLAAAHKAKPEIIVAGLNELDAIDAAAEQARLTIAQLAHDAGTARDLCLKLTHLVAKARTAAINPKAKRTTPVSRTFTPTGPLKPSITKTGHGEPTMKPGGVRRMMIALAQRPDLNRKQLAVRAGLSVNSGTFANYLGQLRAGSLIDERDGVFALTQKGHDELGEFTPLPEGAELRIYWQDQLGGGMARMLIALAAVYPQSITREQLGEHAGIASGSGTFANYLGKLRTLELVEGKKELKMSPELA